MKKLVCFHAFPVTMVTWNWKILYPWQNKLQLKLNLDLHIPLVLIEKNWVVTIETYTINSVTIGKRLRLVYSKQSSFTILTQIPIPGKCHDVFGFSWQVKLILWPGLLTPDPYHRFTLWFWHLSVDTNWSCDLHFWPLSLSMFYPVTFIFYPYPFHFWPLSLSSF